MNVLNKILLAGSLIACFCAGIVVERKRHEDVNGPLLFGVIVQCVEEQEALRKALRACETMQAPTKTTFTSVSLP